MMILAVVVGLGSGAAAVVLKPLIELIGKLLTGWFDVSWNNFLLLLYPGVGMLLSLLFVRYVVRDDIGHGVTKVLFAISRNNSRIKRHNMWTSMLSSSVTIGFGGSVGAEAPIVYTGAAIGSNVARSLGLSYRNMTILLCCGAAGAVAGIFKAPMAGILFCLEILLFNISMSSILPLLLSSVTATTVSYLFLGREVPFTSTVDPFAMGNLPYYLLLGVFCGLVSLYFLRTTLSLEDRIKKISKKIARELQISGPFNIQFLARENDIKVIECNLRASRSFPFVSKVLKINLIEIATRIMLGLPVEKPAKSLFDLDYVGIKASQFSFNRLQKADPVLGVDMASTGEVGCLGEDSRTALLKSMLSVGQRIPAKNILLSTGAAKQKAEMLEAAKMLVDHGYQLYATGGTSRYLTENGIPNELVYWPSEDGQPQALTMLHERKIDMVVNVPKDLTAGELDNGYKIRRAAIDLNIPLITNARLASAFIYAFCTVAPDDLDIKSWQEYGTGDN